jgi:fused signal recognition particle receptor
MLKFIKRKSTDDKTPADESSEANAGSMFSRLKQGLRRSRQQFGSKFGELMLGKKVIDDELLEDIQTQLLLADIGIDTSQKIIDNLAQQVRRKELTQPDVLLERLQQLLVDILTPVAKPLVIDHKPHVVLFVGINGSGKTTTIGKLAKQFQQQGKKIMLAAGDTFRAAAIDQLKVWGDRNDIPVIAQAPGADSAAVVFDSLEAATARDIDILIADTAGRLHTQTNLMEELKKVTRVIKKIDDTAPHSTLLVLDASTGQNALQQAKQFHEAVQLDGICLTKLDGTAKGGIIFAIADQLKLPIYYIGIGEGIDDLRPFEPADFVQALFSEREDANS